MLKHIFNLPTIITSFIGKVINELRQVNWLGFKQVVKYTLLVVVLVSIITLFIFGIDQLLVLGRNYLFTIKI